MPETRPFLRDQPILLRNAPGFWPLLSSLLAVTAFVIGWNLISVILSKDLLPGPFAVMHQVTDSWHIDPMLQTVSGKAEGLAFHTKQTVFRFIRFMASGLACGIVLIILSAINAYVLKFSERLIWLFNPIPPLLLLPIIHAAGCSASNLEWIGGAFYPGLAFLSVGLGSIASADPLLIRMMREAGASKHWIALNISLPTVEAFLLPALKTHGAFTIGLTIVVEWMLAPNGLGRVMKYSLSFNSGSLLLAAVLLVVCLSCCYEFVVDNLVKWRLRWRTKVYRF